MTLKFTCNFNGSGLRNTDIQVYSERKSNWQDAIVSNSELMLLSYICFKILEQKNLIISKVVKNDMFMRKYVPNKTRGKIHGAECRDISGTFLRPTSGKFESELAERAPHDRETGLKITREVHVFLVFIKIAFKKSLLPYGF